MKGTFFHLNFSYYVSFSPCSSLEWRRGCAYFYLSHWSKSYLAIVKAKSRGMNKEYILLLTYLSFISEGNSVTWEGFWLNEAYWTIGWKKNRAEVSSCRGAKKLKFHPHYTEFSVPVPILLFEYEPSRGDMKLPHATATHSNNLESTFYEWSYITTCSPCNDLDDYLAFNSAWLDNLTYFSKLQTSSKSAVVIYAPQLLNKDKRGVRRKGESLQWKWESQNHAEHFCVKKQK